MFLKGVLRAGVSLAIGVPTLYGSFRFGEWVGPVVQRELRWRGRHDLAIPVAVGVAIIGGGIIGYASRRTILAIHARI